jgi:hypothetical protein
MQDIKEIKKILYRLEDITALGTQLPLVAFPQLKQHLQNMKAEDDLAMNRVYDEVDMFIKKHQDDFIERDERALSRGFVRMKKKNPDRLDDYRIFHERLRMIREFVI